MKLLYIVGVGRSGTSLLQSMLSANSTVAYLPETSFFRRYAVFGLLHNQLHNRGTDSVIKVLRDDKQFIRTEMAPSVLVERAKANSNILDLAIYKELLYQFSGDTKEVVGDKDPRLIEWLPALSCAFEGQADIINIIRDPRDVLASKKKASWSRKGHVWKHIFANRVQLRLGRLNGRNAFGDRYYEVIYEDLIARPKKVLTDLCESIGISFEESMLSFGEAAKKIVSKDEVSWKKETFGPLLKGNKEKWRSELSPREIRLTELCCAEAIGMGQYQVSGLGQRLSLRDRLWITVGFFVIKAATGPYIIYRNLKVAGACRKIKGSATES